MAALAAAALLCTGCSDKAAQTASTANQTDAAAQTDTTSAKSIQEVYQEIEQSVSLHSPQCMDDDFISNYYGIDAASLEEYVFSMSEDAAQAETIIIMKVKNTDDLENLAASLQTSWTRRKTRWKTIFLNSLRSWKRARFRQRITIYGS